MNYAAISTRARRNGCGEEKHTVKTKRLIIMETKLLLATAFAAMSISIPAVSQSNWVKTNFPTSMPNKMYITRDGHILVGEYSKNFSQVLPYNGGLFVSPDLGETWEKIDIPDYKYTAFLEVENDIYIYIYIYLEMMQTFTKQKITKNGNTYHIKPFTKMKKNWENVMLLHFSTTRYIVAHLEKL